MVVAVDGGGVGSVSYAGTGGAAVPDPQVEDRVLEVANAAQNGEDSVIYHVATTLEDGSLSQAQKDEFVARLVELTSGAEFETDDGPLFDPGRAHLVTELDEIGVGETVSTGVRDEIQSAIARSVDSGRLGADELSGLFDARYISHSDGTRQLISEVTDGNVLGRVAYELYGESRRGGFDVGNEGQVAMLTSAADIAGMAGQHGYPYAANGVTAFVADNPAVLQASREIEWNFHGFPPEGRGSLDAFSSALAGTNNSLTFADGTGPQDRFDMVFSELVNLRAAEGGYPGQYHEGTYADSLGDYFARHVERLNDRTTNAGSWNDEGEGAEPSTYQSLTERFVRNVMLHESFDNSAASDAIASEMRRLGDTIVAPPGQYAPNQAERTEAARELGTLFGSVQGAANEYIADATGGSEEKVAGLRSITDLLTGKALERTGPVGGVIGGAAVDSFWEGVVADATRNAAGETEDATGVLDDLGNSLDAAIKQRLGTIFPADESDTSGIDYGAILADYDSSAELHRN